MAYLQYFGAGLAAMGVFGVGASMVSPDQGGSGTIALGVVLLCVGIAVLVLSGRKASG